MAKFSTVVSIVIPVMYVIMTIVYEAGNFVYYDKRGQIQNPGPSFLPGNARYYHVTAPGVGLGFLVSNLLAKRCGSKNCVIGWSVANFIIGGLMFVLIYAYYTEHRDTVAKCDALTTCPNQLGLCWWVAFIGLCGVIVFQMLASLELCCVGVCVKKGKHKDEEEERQTINKTGTKHEPVYTEKPTTTTDNKPWGSRSQYTDNDLHGLKAELEPVHTNTNVQSNSRRTTTETRNTDTNNNAPIVDDLASRYSGSAYEDLNSRDTRGGESSLNSRYSGSSYGSAW